MSYVPIVFDSTTGVTPARLRHIEEQYDRAKADIGGEPRIISSQPIMAEKRATAPAGVEGRIYYNTANNRMYLYDGISWKEC